MCCKHIASSVRINTYVTSSETVAKAFSPCVVDVLSIQAGPRIPVGMKDEGRNEEIKSFPFLILFLILLSMSLCHPHPLYVFFLYIPYMF